MSNKKERGIIFSSEMVNAILDGRKTQTRRVVNMNSGICKYGMVGDLLYVKEAWEHSTHPLHKKWRSPRFMPKSAARIWLEITDICIEKLQDISKEDALAEGIETRYPDKEFMNTHHSFSEDVLCFKDYKTNGWEQSIIFREKHSFASLWQSIKGEESWYANPWVWVIKFKRID